MNVSLAPLTPVLLTPVLLTLVLAGCSTTTDTVGTDINVVPIEASEPSAVCGVWLGVTWSSEDSEQTVREIKANNRARKAWCI